MTETETPGYAERDDDETTEQTGGGVDPADTDAETGDQDDEQGSDEADA